MQRVTCIYLHGFLSSGKSQKGQWFKQQSKQLSCEDVSANLGAWCFAEWLTPTYPIVTPQTSMDVINQLVINHLDSEDKLVLMGSSMGGFYARALGERYQVPYIMINPALNPLSIFSNHGGEQQHPTTGEYFEINDEYLAQLDFIENKSLQLSNQSDVPALLLMDSDDEVIDKAYVLSKYRDGEKSYHVHCFEGGDHAFQHCEQSMPLVKNFIERYVV